MRHILSLLLIVGCGKSTNHEESARDEPAPTKQPSEPAAAAKPAPAPAPAPKPELPGRYASNNKLIVVHYPAGFEAETSGKSAVIVSGQLGNDVSVSLGFVSIPEPTSDKVEEFDRIVYGAVSKSLEGYVELSTRECSVAGVKGIEHVGTFVSKGIPLTRHSCQLTRNGHGYAFSFSIPQNHPEVVPELEQIRAATEFSE